MPDTAPIVLFVYNRLDHTQRTVQALLENQLAAESDLFIYSDAPKNAEASFSVNQVRSYLKTISGFRNVYIRLRDKNLGVDENVILGVTEVINEKGRIIVLEDDLVTSPYFLKYMNDALQYYHNETRVISIHGYSYALDEKLKETFFLKGADCWGWATWKRGWDLMELDGQKLLDQFTDDQLRTEFNFGNTYPYIKALEQQALGHTAHWDIRWYASAFLLGKLTLYPGQSLVKNIGHDASGTHCGVSNVYNVELATSEVNVETEIIPDQQAYLAFSGFLRSMATSAPQQKKRFRWIQKYFKLRLV
jgi:hypothetical protein